MSSTLTSRLLALLAIISLPLLYLLKYLKPLGAVMGEAAWLVLTLVVLACIALSAWLLKRKLRSRMEKGLGRQVEDHELTSISTWMRIPAEARQAGKDADEYKFNDHDFSG